MKRVLLSCLAVTLFALAAVCIGLAKGAYAEYAPVRVRIEQLRNGAEVQKTDIALEKAEQEMKAYCASEGVRCDTYGRGSIKIDKVTGKVKGDGDVRNPFFKNIERAQRERNSAYSEIWIHERALNDSGNTVDVAALSFSAFVTSLVGLLTLRWAFKKKKVPVQELTQDEQDRLELVQLRERTHLLEYRLASQSYREPDRLIEPVVPQRVVPPEEPAAAEVVKQDESPRMPYNIFKFKYG